MNDEDRTVDDLAIEGGWGEAVPADEQTMRLVGWTKAVAAARGVDWRTDFIVFQGPLPPGPYVVNAVSYNRLGWGPPLAPYSQRPRYSDAILRGPKRMTPP